MKGIIFWFCEPQNHVATSANSRAHHTACVKLSAQWICERSNSISLVKCSWEQRWQPNILLVKIARNWGIVHISCSETPIRWCKEFACWRCWFLLFFNGSFVKLGILGLGQEPREIQNHDKNRPRRHWNDLRFVHVAHTHLVHTESTEICCAKRSKLESPNKQRAEGTIDHHAGESNVHSFLRSTSNYLQ